MQLAQLELPRRRLLARLEAAGERFAAEGSLPASVLAELQAPLVDPRVYQIIANAHWSGVKGDPREEKQ